MQSDIGGVAIREIEVLPDTNMTQVKWAMRRLEHDGFRPRLKCNGRRMIVLDAPKAGKTFRRMSRGMFAPVNPTAEKTQTPLPPLPRPYASNFYD